LATTPISQVRGGVNDHRISAMTAGIRPFSKSLAARRAAAGLGADARTAARSAALTRGRAGASDSPSRSGLPILRETIN
jgi:hypothetical protein